LLGANPHLFQLSPTHQAFPHINPSKLTAFFQAPVPTIATLINTAHPRLTTWTTSIFPDTPCTLTAETETRDIDQIPRRFPQISKPDIIILPRLNLSTHQSYLEPHKRFLPESLPEVLLVEIGCTQDWKFPPPARLAGRSSPIRSYSPTPATSLPPSAPSSNPSVTTHEIKHLLRRLQQMTPT